MPEDLDFISPETLKLLAGMPVGPNTDWRPGEGRTYVENDEEPERLPNGQYLVNGVVCAEEDVETAQLFTLRRELNFEKQYTAKPLYGPDGRLIRKSGADKFEDVLASSENNGPYFPYRQEVKAIEENSGLLSKDRGWFEIGQARGKKSRAFFHRHGFPANFHFFDIVPYYLNENKKALEVEGVAPNAIHSHCVDYTSPEFRHALEEAINDNGDRPKTFAAFGNEVNNESLRYYLRVHRPYLKPGDVIYLGMDNTWDEKTLLDCYLEPTFGEWNINGAHVAITEDFNYLNLDRDQLVWMPYITTDLSSERRRVNFHVGSAAQELCMGSLDHSVDPETAIKIMDRLQKRMPFDGVYTGYSDRYSREANIGIIHEEGYRLVKRGGRHDEHPLPVSRDPDRPHIDNGVYELELAA